VTINDLDDLRATTVEDDFDDDMGGYGDELTFEGEGTGGGGGFTSTERLIVAGLVLLNVVALLVIVYMLVIGI